MPALVLLHLSSQAGLRYLYVLKGLAVFLLRIMLKVLPRVLVMPIIFVGSARLEDLRETALAVDGAPW